MPARNTIRVGFDHLGWTTAFLGWSLGVAAMLWWTTSYEFSSHEDPTTTVSLWPNESALKLVKNRPTLVFFMHPKCPCTRASLTELRKLLEASNLTEYELPEVTVVVSEPTDAPAGWSATDTVRDAATLPRANILTDAGGVESERFGVATSGTVMLFDTAGTRLFAGGVTTSRGHEGDSAGGVMLAQLLRRDPSAAASTVPAFGCQLCTSHEGAASCQEAGGTCGEPRPEEVR